MRTAARLVLVALVCAACTQTTGDDAGSATPDAATLRDAGAVDASAAVDAAVVDGGTADAGGLDASVPDSGGLDAAARDASAPDATMNDAAVLDAAVPDAAAPDAATADAAVPDCVAAVAPGAPAMTTVVDGPTMATASQSASGGPCARTFVLTSTAVRRDNLPANPRTVGDDPAAPVLHSGNTMLDALFALAIAEARENSVAAISDGAFSNGAPRACPTGGCFETGRLWTYAWTRDSSYSVDLGLAWLDPVRARNTLEFKLSAQRQGGDEQVVQDTGTGGSYPVSTDRVVWALGGQALLEQLSGADRAAFETRARTALTNTVEHDRAVAFDDVTGLYRGEQSFLDWREQSYPAWVAGDPVHVGMSQTLSTNALHLAALRWLVQLSTAAGDTTAATRYSGWADALRASMRATFVRPNGTLSTYVTTTLDPAPVERMDLLGTSLAVLHGVVTPQEARAALSAYPHLPRGVPVFWPQQKETPIYHNRAIWPFVTAYAARAARTAQHDAVVNSAVQSLTRAAALNLSNMENLELVSGDPFVNDGAYSGPVVNSQRQLWSVAGFLSLVTQTLLGVGFQDNSMTVAPFIPRAVRNTWLGNTSMLVLNRVSWQGKALHVLVHLPPTDGRMDGAYGVTGVAVNGAPVTGPIPWNTLNAANVVEVTLDNAGGTAAESLTTITSTADYRALFAPRPPTVTGVAPISGGLRVSWAHNEDNAADITVNVWRGVTRVAADLPGTTTQFDDLTAPNPATTTNCYTVETVFRLSGNHSQHAAPVCDWGNPSRVQSIPASAFTAVGGNYVFNHGRNHYENWGDPGHTITATFTAQNNGVHLIQPVAGNGAGPINTGITAGIKHVRVERVSDGVVVGQGYAVMPHLGTWDVWKDGSFVRATLSSGTAYRIVVDMDAYAVNMSVRDHFSVYTGGLGGTAGAFHRVNIAELKVLALGIP